MQYQAIKGLEKEVSRIVLGSAKFTMSEYERYSKILDAAYDSGINTIDTAVIYGDSECVIGKWLKERTEQDADFRKKIIILTKGGHFNNIRPRTTPYDIYSDFYESMARLQIDFVDIYIIHRDDENYPVGPIVEAMNRLKDAGKVGVFGGSNWSIQRLEAANDYALKHHLEPFRVASPQFSMGKLNGYLFHPSDVSLSGDEEAQNWYAENNIPVFCYTSLALGFFAGAIKSCEKDRAKEILSPNVYKVMATDYNFEILKSLEEEAAQKGITVMQASLKWLLSQKFLTFPIFSTSKPERLEDIRTLFTV